MAQNNAPEIWQNLEPGPYKVGYKVMHLYDHSRSFKPKYDYEGNFINEENSRPVQVSVWYPAIWSEHPEYVKFEDYVFSKASECDFRYNDEAKKGEYINNQKEGEIRRGADKEKLEKMYSRRCYSVVNAVPERGSFPLIIYAPGYNGLSYQNTCLYEYVASYGYVIASSPSNGKYSPEMTSDLIGIEAQVRDMEFILAEMRNFPNVDKNIIGCIGYSFGGVSNILFALRNYNIDAALCLEGSILYGSAPRKIKISPYYIPKNMRAAFMYIGRSSSEKEYTMHFYDNAIYADAFFLTFNDLLHRHLNSRQIMLYDHAGKNISKDRIEYINICYETICRYTLHFFNAYLKKEKNSKVFIDRIFEEKKVPDYIVTAKSRKGYKVPPKEEYFFNIIRNEGIAAAIEIFKNARKIDPEVILFSESGLNRIGYEIMRSNRKKEALEIFKLNAQNYPKSSNVFDSLGEAYMLNGNNELAIKNYKKSLEINPENTNAAKMLEKLKNQN